MADDLKSQGPQDLNKDKNPAPPSPAGAGFGGQSPPAREGGLQPPPTAPKPLAPISSVPKPFTPPLPPKPAGLPTAPPSQPTPLTPPKPSLGESAPLPTPPPVAFKTPPPPPKPMEISLRTMKSDLDSLKKTGAGGEAPKSLPTVPTGAGGTVPPTPPSPGGLTKPGLPKAGVKSDKLKPILIIAGVVIFGIILALIGFFVIFPFFFPSEEPAPTPTQTAPTQQLPTQPDITSDFFPAPTAPKPHQSLLRIPADLQSSLPLPALNASNLRQALLAEANNQPGVPNALKEVLLSDAGGQLSFANVLPLLLPEFSRLELNNLFEEDFTTLLYYDANGVWPAWIAKLKSGANLAGTKTLMARIETSASLANLYLSPPGTPTSFKNGQVGSVATRYLAFSLKGASLNYGWSNNKFVISTSFNGMKKIISNL